MSEEILVETITTKEGSTDGRPWKRYGIKDGNGEWYSTFDEATVARLKEGGKARIEYTSKPVNGRILKNLVSAEPVENGTVPEQYSHQRPDGEADWDKVAIGKTRCALWMHYLAGQLAASVYVKAANVEGVDPREAVIRTGIMFVVAAEKDTFERPPGDDGIPF
jgi:hypothetical protein